MGAHDGLQPARNEAVRVRVRGGVPEGWRAVVANVTLSALWLVIGPAEPPFPRLAADEAVELTLEVDGRPLTVTTRFEADLGRGRLPMFSVGWPPVQRTINRPADGRQRRAHIRIEAACPIEYTVVTQSDRAAAGQTGTGTTIDISAGGVLFETDGSPDELPGVCDGLEIVLEFDGDVVMAEAEVVRVIGSGPSRDPRVGAFRSEIAVRFVGIDRWAQDRIVRHIFAHMRRHREDDSVTA